MNKTQKGITLIALIITIIVLLILAVVTISAVNEGSIFAHANNAATRYSQEAERENALLHNLLGTLPGEDGSSSSSGDDTTATDGTWTYNSETGKYEKGEKSYAVGDTLSNSEVLEALGIETGGTYSGTWSVLGLTNDNKLKLVSTENVGNCTLGYKDEVANSAKTSEEYSAMENSEKMERGLASYQRAVQTLNEAAQTATGITSAESIDLQDIEDLLETKGADPIDKGTDYGKIYNYYYDTTKGKVCSKNSTDGGTTWSSPYTTPYTSETFVNTNGEKIVVDSEGDEITLTCNYIRYDLTADQKTAIGSLATGTYWLSSPCIRCEKTDPNFRINLLDDGGLFSDFLFAASSITNLFRMYGVRAVVSI